MFTIEARNSVRAAILRLASDDPRVVGAAAVGSLALGEGDRFSDLDLTFAVVSSEQLTDVMADWTTTLARQLGATVLVDLERPPTTYRVLLLPDQLQCDLSMTPVDAFRPAGPRFRLLFGSTAHSQSPMASSPGTLFIPTPAIPGDVFGWGIIYALHARACIERGRVWQAEHYLAAVRDHGLSLACIRENVAAVQARGYDDLSAATQQRFAETYATSLRTEALRRPLAIATTALMAEGADFGLPNAEVVAHNLGDFVRSLEATPTV